MSVHCLLLYDHLGYFSMHLIGGFVQKLVDCYARPFSRHALRYQTKYEIDHI